MIDDTMTLAPVRRTAQERYEHAVWLLSEAGYQVQPRLLPDTVVYDVRCGATTLWPDLSLDDLVAVARREFGHVWVQRARANPSCVRDGGGGRFHVVSRNEAQPEVKQAILAAARRYDRDTLQPFAAHIQSLGGKASWHDMLYAIETNDTVAARLMMLCEDRAEYAAIRTEMLQRFLTSPSLSQQLIGLIYDGVGNYLETIPER